jgi:CelD/BcsL family acetyltransferase involved in cellulose biosynthesis
MTALAVPVSAVSAAARVRIIDPITDPHWDEFVNTHSLASPFHHSAWASVLVDTYQYEPRYHVLERDGTICAGWPTMLIRSRVTGTRLVTLPFSDYCEPLVTNQDDGQRLYESLVVDSASLGASRIEVRGWLDGTQPPSGLVACSGYVRHLIDLRPGLDQVRARLSENARRSLKKASQLGVSTRISAERSDLDTFVRLNLRLRRKHGMLPQPRRFFESIWSRLIETGRGYVLLAERQEQPLAALLCLRQGDVTVDKFAVNDETAAQFRGSHAAMWAVIEREIERGAAWYDMGRSDAAAEGLHRYKSQWGGVMRDATYYFHPGVSGTSTEDPKGFKKAALGAFARLAPDAIFMTTGNIVYRHLG